VYEPTVAPENIRRVRTLLAVSSVGAANTAAATYVLVLSAIVAPQVESRTTLFHASTGNA
jgi:hypothetical protein